VSIDIEEAIHPDGSFKRKGLACHRLEAKKKMGGRKKKKHRSPLKT